LLRISAAVTATGGVEFGRVQHFFELGHPVFFLAKNCPLPVSYFFGFVARSQLQNKPRANLLRRCYRSISVAGARQTRDDIGRRPIPKYYGRSPKEWRILVTWRRDLSSLVGAVVGHR
jgi:hypothetical protein